MCGIQDIKRFGVRVHKYKIRYEIKIESRTWNKGVEPLEGKADAFGTALPDVAHLLLFDDVRRCVEMRGFHLLGVMYSVMGRNVFCWL